MSALIVTLLVDPASQDGFDALRRAHFPPERNVLAAHVTLFHALPAGEQEQLEADLADAARRPAFGVAVSGLRSLGGGVAFSLESAELARLRAGLAERWRPWLTRQDAQPFRPHVTVQNKVAPERARSLLAALREGFTPYEVQARGLGLWRYLGGPWEPVARWELG